MKEINTQSWTAGRCFECFGIRIGVRASDPEFLTALREYLPPGHRPVRDGGAERVYSVHIENGTSGRDAEPRFTVYGGAETLACVAERQEALEALEAAIALDVATRARGHLFVHAGVVAWGGEAIVIPGRSFSGKTTLVASLVRAGATYYSDEYAVLDASGLVWPFSRPLAIRTASSGLRQRYTAEALGGVGGAGPLSVGLVLLCEYRAGARWRPRLLSPGRAILALLANTVPARAQPRRALAVLRRAVEEATVLKGYRGEADDLARTLLEEERPDAAASTRGEPRSRRTVGRDAGLRSGA